jgi:hypothetical protein
LIAGRLELGLETTRLGKFEIGVDCRRVRVRVRTLGGDGRVNVKFVLRVAAAMSAQLY